MSKTLVSKTSHKTNSKSNSTKIKAVKGHSAPASCEQFTKSFYPHNGPSVTAREDMERKASETYEFISKRTNGKPKIEIAKGKSSDNKPRTVLKILNNDKTFLVDSVLAEVSRLGYKVYEIYHPVVKAVRDKNGRLQEFNAKTGKAESVIYLEISYIENPVGLDSLKKNLESVLKALYFAVDDWRGMLVKVDETVKTLHQARKHFSVDQVDETMDFLKWLADDHFTFLGYAEYETHGKKLKLIPNSCLGVSRPEAAQEGNSSVKEGDLSNPHELLDITKSDFKAIVHRSVYMDHIGVKKFDAKGKVIGERRFLGLFASSAYYQSTSTIPVIRQKVKYVREKSGFARGGHSAKIVQFILDSYPRDEIFQSTADELLKNTLSILELTERPNVGLYIRRDNSDRFLSCLIYVPKEKFDTALRFKIQKILEKNLDGKVAEYYTSITDSPLSRLHLIIKPNNAISKYNIEELRGKIAEVSNLWGDELLNALSANANGESLFTKYENAFPKDYTAIYNSRHAAHDILKIEETLQSNQLQVEFYQHNEGDNSASYHLKTYTPGESIALSDVLPILENFGLRVISEKPFFVEPHNNDKTAFIGVGISDFEVVPMNGQPIEFDVSKEILETAFKKAVLGEVENDSLNKLVLYANLPWRDVVVLRAYTRYLRQAGLALGLNFFIDALTAQANLTNLLVRLFYAYFDPKAKSKKPEAIIEEIEKDLATVSNLNEDRAIRRLNETIQSTIRTNFFQTTDLGANKDYVSFKLDSRKVPDLPLPRPLYEVFVYSPNVEGIHLRGGMVARGGLRWSDRFEDFRTEILGLMKAQMVKNSVIVPVGSKGGFIVKGDVPEDRDAKLKQGIECYKTFLRGVLDVTDNIVKGKVVPPKDVIRRDGDDPYLVVAADKGTATFSDIANGISEEYNFWLGDAFASGGSAGYDHKKMGITAKGGWISVQRHFRELGIDVQEQDHTCIGIGDMSGDVFGNGLLLSEHTRLVAAFNHMHIFIDPHPPTEDAFKERKRLFNLARSGWDDYDKKLISPGGGVFKRSEKSIKLTPEIKTLLQVQDNSLSPDELIRTILKAPVDLLWNGGIGTYVKAESENARDVGDKTNDNLRINGKELRARVVGEGGNLGFTQLGRIEYAFSGGRINTDAIDNSAGVDTSDHEVNIKIPLQAAIEKKKLTLANRNKLLVKMTDEVAELVLRDNYLQTQAISIAETKGASGNEARASLMRTLEESGLLKRKIEFLPSDEEISRRTALKQSFTRPEISVLLAYSKIWLYNQLVESKLPDEDYFKEDLLRYFPKELHKKYAHELHNHKLRREIIATYVTNSIVNRAGSTFFTTIIRDSGMKAEDIASAYVVTRDAFNLRDIWKDIENLDAKVDAKIQYEMFLTIGTFIERQTMWFLRNAPLPLNVEKTIQQFKPDIEKFSANIDRLENDYIAEKIEENKNRLVQFKVPEKLAKRVASLRAIIAACDVALISQTSKIPLTVIGNIYFQIGQRLSFNWLRTTAFEMPTDNYWQRLASKNLIDSLFEQQRRIAREITSHAGKNGAAEAALKSWEEENADNLARHDKMVAELQKTDKFDLAMLIAAVRRIETLGSV